MKDIQSTHQRQGVKSSDEYYTPIEIVNALGHFDLDPATPPNPQWRTADVMLTKEDDGLKQHWFGRVFLNPPYSHPLVEQFMDRMAHHRNGIAVLIPKVGTAMFRDIIYPYADAIFITRKRIHFFDENWVQRKDAICQTMFVAYGIENVKAIENSGIDGQFLYTKNYLDKIKNPL